jgi:hypothetical protein
MVWLDGPYSDLFVQLGEQSQSQEEEISSLLIWFTAQSSPLQLHSMGLFWQQQQCSHCPASNTYLWKIMAFVVNRHIQFFCNCTELWIWYTALLECLLNSCRIHIHCLNQESLGFVLAAIPHDKVGQPELLTPKCQRCHFEAYEWQWTSLGERERRFFIL